MIRPGTLGAPAVLREDRPRASGAAAQFTGVRTCEGAPAAGRVREALSE